MTRNEHAIFLLQIASVLQSKRPAQWSFASNHRFILGKFFVLCCNGKRRSVKEDYEALWVHAFCFLTPHSTQSDSPVDIPIPINVISFEDTLAV
jgi:hypothetical protein